MARKLLILASREPIPDRLLGEKAVAHSNCAQNRNILFKCPRWSILSWAGPDFPFDPDLLRPVRPIE